MTQQQLPRSFGPYSLLKMLAKGGMGEIYLARSGGISNFEKFYAIKKLLQKFSRDQDVTARFIDEAKLGARLQHPNIVQVYDLGAVGEEMYMATEFVDGFDLRRVLRFCHEKKKRIPLDIALFIVREILSGLAYAHRQVDAEGQSINLIHRDISPQNVLVSFEGEVKIIDFGLAKSTQRSQETQANVLLGNFGYMSPEQARGHVLDVRTDVYSTGIVLFELVTGTKRFVDENPLRLLEMVARPTPIMPSDRMTDIPRAIDRIYREAAAPDKDKRLATAEDFRDKVTTALHRLNPRAQREHLAQFLNHLFLGGAAPPEVDNDLLNKSVAIQLHDIVAQTEAFNTTKRDDVRNRGLTSATGYEEDAVQTNSHELMRSARVGDALTHQELTGQAAGPSFGGVPAEPPPPAQPQPVSAPAPVSAPIPAAPPPAAAAPPPELAPIPVTAPNAAPVVDPAELPPQASLVTKPRQAIELPPEQNDEQDMFVTLADMVTSSENQAVDTGDDEFELELGPLASSSAIAPSPSYPAASSPAPALADAAEALPTLAIESAPNTLEAEEFEVLEPLEEDEPTVVGHEGPPVSDIDLSLEELGGTPDANSLAAAQAFGDPVASSAEVEAWNPNAPQDASTSPTSVYEAPQWSGEPTVPPQEPAKVTSKLEPIPTPEPVPTPTPIPRPAPIPSPTPIPTSNLPKSAAPLRPARPASSAPVVSTMAAEPEPEKPEPTVVIDMESLPGAEVIEPPDAGGFGEGSGESLIIDFDASDDESSLPPSEPPPQVESLEPIGGPKIRPAAQPRGKIATGKVARPPRRGGQLTDE
jgi:serine/threonine protein kinase